MKKNTVIALLFFMLGVGTAFIVLDNQITVSDVRNAQKLMGLEFEDSEIDSMLEGLTSFREAYMSNRMDTLENSVLPSLIFNPAPSGFKPNRLQYPVNFGKDKKQKRPNNVDDLAFYSVRELASLIREQKVTALELTQFFIARLKKYDPSLHCVITLTEDYALAKAREADKEIKEGRYRGVLHGIPFGAKDLLAKKGFKTTWGAAPYKNQVIDEDATVITRLEEAGAILVVKLSMGALAWGDVWYGEKTRNPWNPESGSSGSSAGSAAAVSAGLVPFAIGTETLGSIVSPSTVCGVTGLRPSFGRVSRYGAMALSWSMDKIGPICRNAEDCALIFNVISGPDGKDPSLWSAGFNYNVTKKVNNYKVGYVQSAFEGDYRFRNQDSIMLEKVRELGFELVPIELPDPRNLNFILSAEAGAAFDLLTRSNEDDRLVLQIKNAWPNVFRTSRFIPAVEYIQANRLRTQLIEEMHRAIAGVDVYLAPSWKGSNLLITNLTGHPSIVLPTAFSNGRPASITINGQLFGEDKVLLFAKYIQDNTDFHLKHPPGF